MNNIINADIVSFDQIELNKIFLKHKIVSEYPLNYHEFVRDIISITNLTTVWYPSINSKNSKWILN